MFDLRHLEHSTIIYEEPSRTPLLRLAWNKQDFNYLATFAQDSTEVSRLFKIIFTNIGYGKYTELGTICLLILYMSELDLGDCVGYSSSMYTGCSTQQPSCMRQWSCMGATFFMSYMHCW